MKATPEKIIREEIRALSAYHIPDSCGLVKLDAMENPYGLPEAMRGEIARLAESAALNRYPDPSAGLLKARLRQAMDIPAQADVLLGNGSDEIIQILALAVARPGAVIMGVEPSFVMFRMIAAFAGVRFVGVPLGEDFALDPGAMAEAIRLHQPALIFLAYPNNPTGNLFDRAEVSRIIETAPGLVVVDEAYHAFAGQSFMPMLGRYANLLVMRTLSKLGLAGLRLGLVAGGREWLRELDKLRLPYNVNVLTQVLAEAVLAQGDELGRQAEAIKVERSRLLDELRRTPKVKVFVSDANFILFRTPKADRVFQGLKERRVLIKNLNGTHPQLGDCLRVTVGTPGENDIFLAALRKSIHA